MDVTVNDHESARALSRKLLVQASPNCGHGVTACTGCASDRLSAPAADDSGPDGRGCRANGHRHFDFGRGGRGLVPVRHHPRMRRDGDEATKAEALDSPSLGRVQWAPRGHAAGHAPPGRAHPRLYTAECGEQHGVIAWRAAAAHRGTKLFAARLQQPAGGVPRTGARAAHPAREGRPRRCQPPPQRNLHGKHGARRARGTSRG